MADEAATDRITAGGTADDGGNVPFLHRLSTKLLLLTIAFVLIAEILIFPPSLANFRLQWLQQRLATAASVGTVLLQQDAAGLQPNVRSDVLRSLGVKAVAVRDGDASRLLIVEGMPPEVDDHVDVDAIGPAAAILGAASTLFAGGDKILRVTGRIGDDAAQYELLIPDYRLRKAMLAYARNIALLSLLISAITAALVFASIRWLLIRPIRQLRTSMLAFGEAPDDPSRILVPSARLDELGVAERELAGMQRQLGRTLGERKRLADLGLAVSKINHDMRNILASAQLISDRLGSVRDPAVQSFAPKLVRALDRAVGYTESVLSYGRAQETPPARRRIRLRQLVEEVEGLLGIDPAHGIEFVNEIDDAFEVDADAEHLFRVLTNLCRNSVQAMSAEQESAVIKRLAVIAERQGALARIIVSDTGPGLPQKARENLFAAFRGSARSGGTGLGLAIAFELIRAHGGSIELVESKGGSTVFAIAIPDQPISLDEAREARRA